MLAICKLISESIFFTSILSVHRMFICKQKLPSNLSSRRVYINDTSLVSSTEIYYNTTKPNCNTNKNKNNAPWTKVKVCVLLFGNCDTISHRYQAGHFDSLLIIFVVVVAVYCYWVLSVSLKIALTWTSSIHRARLKHHRSFLYSLSCTAFVYSFF